MQLSLKKCSAFTPTVLELTVSIPQPAQADSFPSSSVQMITSHSAGISINIMARISEKLIKNNQVNMKHYNSPN